MTTDTRPCKVVMDGFPCAGSATYRATLDDCAICRIEFGSLFCLGHSFCVAHAAAVRTATYVFDVEDDDEDGGLADVSRMWEPAGGVR